MKKLYTLLTLALLPLIAIAQKSYQLVWNEDFTEQSLDMNVWNIEVNGDGGGNNELQYYCEKGVSSIASSLLLPKSSTITKVAPPAV